MIGTAAAIIGAGLLGAGASIYGAGEASDAAEEAAQKGSETLSANTVLSIAEQRRQFDETQKMLREQQALAKPFVEAGTAATGKLRGYLTGGPAGMTEFGETLRATPGYNFLQQEAQKGTERQLARMGLSNSGRALQELEQRRMGLADSTAQSYMANLMGLAGFGTQGLGMGNATAGALASAGQSSANQIGGALQNLGANQANLLQSAGQTRASSYGQMSGAVTGLMGGLARFGPGLFGGDDYGYGGIGGVGLGG